MISSPQEELGLQIPRPTLSSQARLEKALGAGPMSVVYRGHVEGHGECAIKVWVAPGYVGYELRKLREASLAQAAASVHA